MLPSSNRITRAEVDRYRRYLVAEWDAAYLYRRLAAAETTAARARVLEELARIEERHAARWRTRLQSAGEPLPEWKPTFRARALASLARLFGTGSVLPMLEMVERGDANMYAAEPAAQDFSEQERTHIRVFEALRRGQSDPFNMSRREQRHWGTGATSLRAAVFGVNDGLVSNLSLIMGVAAADPGPNLVLLAGLAGLLAGATSMGVGEYVSVKTQQELLERQLELERAELEENPAEEERELRLIYQAKGLTVEEAARVAEQVMSDKGTALQTLAREELGLNPDDLGSPWGAASSSFASFAVGASLPVIPFLLLSGIPAVVASAVVSGVALAVVGALTAVLTGRSMLFAAVRMLLLGAGAAAVTSAIGHLLGVSTGI